jgi:tetratricopeptide (TPR) repeat protein
MLLRVLALIGATILVAPTPSRSDPTEEEPTLARIDPDYAEAKRALAAKDWEAAINALLSAALRDTRNADIQSYLGFAYRKSGQLEPAFRHYEKALALNPRHRGAHEYVGEAYLMAGNIAKAEEHLAALENICLLPCEELEDLKNEIQRYKASLNDNKTPHPPR